MFVSCEALLRKVQVTVCWTPLTSQKDSPLLTLHLLELREAGAAGF